MGGLLTLLVAWFFFSLANRETRAMLRQAQADYTAMLRTFAIVQEQLAGKQLFMRDKDGQLDPSRPYRIMGKVNATLPSPGVKGEGTIR